MSNPYQAPSANIGVPGIFDNLYARIAEMGNVGSQQLRREQRVFFATDEKCWAPDRGEIL